ncbi:hypothetical protein Tco_0515739, partial [Tanacetum coccineum]
LEHFRAQRLIHDGQQGQPEVGRLRCFMMDNRDNGVTRESSRSRGGIGSDKFGKHVREIGQLILRVLTLSLHVPHHSIISLYVAIEIGLRHTLCLRS